MEQELTIQQVAAATGLSVHTLRYIDWKIQHYTALEGRFPNPTGSGLAAGPGG